MTDRWHALLPETAGAEGVAATGGVLHGRTFVAKDNIDVMGSVTAAGSPALRAVRPPASRSAEVVRSLLAAGASYAGKARSDELAFSLGGVNDLDGTPSNPAAPGHTCGGSSSGSAAAVAGGLADVGLGTDTAGSIRVPASYCGLVGMRPTHGRVDADGVLPLAPSYDVVGWLTRDGAAALDTGRVLVRQWRESPPPIALLLATDLLPADEDDAAIVLRTWQRWALALDASPSFITLGRLDEWTAAFHVLRSAEAWGVHGRWLEEESPAISVAVAARLRAGALLTQADVRAAEHVRAALVARLDAAIPPGSALLVPGAAGRAPSLAATNDELDVVRRQTLRLTTIAALAGAPSIVVPARPAGLPFGVALIGRPGDDESLLAAAAQFC